MTDAPADQSVAKAAPNPNLHRIVIVGGGAGGIELVTRLGDTIGLDRARRVVNLAAKLDEDGRLITPVRSIGYDTLVIAIGSVSNDFGTPGVKEHAICLDTPEEAARFN